MLILMEGLVFFLGLAVGSFLNVLIDRLPKEKNVLVGRSYCDHCHHQLAWYDLIPLLSFFVLRGRCRYCGKKISWYYPLVELATGVLFVAVVSGLPACRQAWAGVSGVSEDKVVQTTLPQTLFVICYLLSVICSLIVIFFADLKYGVIPDKIIFPAIAAVLLFHLPPLANSFTPGESKPTPGVVPWLASQRLLGGVLLAGLVAAFFFLFLVWITKGRGMGMGDVKLSFLMGLILGWPKIIVALYFAFLTGALVSVILILSKRKKFGQTIPFGPFLVGGTLMAMFYGNEAIECWLKILK